jgi:hypothetical protein
MTIPILGPLISGGNSPLLFSGVGTVFQQAPLAISAQNSTTSYGLLPTNTNGGGVNVPTAAAASVATNAASTLTNLSSSTLLLIVLALVIFLVVVE